MAEQKLVPTLHHLSQAQSHRVLFALEELAEAHGTKYNVKNYERGKQGEAIPSMKPLFILGKSPILTIEEDGAPSKTVFQHPAYPGVLTESRLCLKFLSDNFGQGLWEADDHTDQQQDIFFQEFANATLAQKVVFVFIFDVIPSRLPFGLRSLVRLMVTPMINHFMGDLRPIFQFMEDTLSDDRPWFAGKKMGLSDLNLSWGMDMATQCGYLEKAKYPKLAKWHETLVSRSAYKSALEKGGNYSLKP